MVVFGVVVAGGGIASKFVSNRGGKLVSDDTLYATIHIPSVFTIN